MAQISISNLRKNYGNVEVLKGVDLDIGDGEFVVFVGRSGCGKSTLLRCIAGLEGIGSGDIAIDGRDVTRLSPSKRGIAMVFQSYALYPHLTVRDNMGFSLALAKRPKAEIARRVEEVARILKIEDLMDRRPGQLSGGQRQRIAIGRAIVREPKAFLFDEPLSNLDADLRVTMRQELMQLHERLSATMIYVTHDQVEAMTMADKIVVLNGGAIEQVGSPLELYAKPRNLFVATFIGSPRMNILATRTAATSGLQLPATTEKVGIRPEHVELTGPGGGVVDGVITMSEHLGADSYHTVQLADGSTVNARTDGTKLGGRGEPVGLRFNLPRLHAFDAGGATIAL